MNKKMFLYKKFYRMKNKLIVFDVKMINFLDTFCIYIFLFFMCFNPILHTLRRVT